MKALDELRKQQEALDAALSSTAPANVALLPFANVLRALADPRSLSERIEATLAEVAGAFPMRFEERDVVGVLRQRLERRLPEFPLVEIPCDKSIRKFIRNSDDGIPQSSVGAS